jgi:hypothetical protein
MLAWLLSLLTIHRIQNINSFSVRHSFSRRLSSLADLRFDLGFVFCSSSDYASDALEVSSCSEADFSSSHHRLSLFVLSMLASLLRPSGRIMLPLSISSQPQPITFFIIETSFTRNTLFM